MSDPKCYIDVWAEPQNVGAAARLRAAITSGHSVRLTLQPGDMTAYHFSITPITDTFDFTVSDDGRKPEGPEHVDRPFGMIVTVLNKGFADRSAHFWAHELDFLPGSGPLDAHFIGERMGCRNICTAMAVLGVLRTVLR